jgi:hypothetical protein
MCLKLLEHCGTKPVLLKLKDLCVSSRQTPAERPLDRINIYYIIYPVVTDLFAALCLALRQV